MLWKGICPYEYMDSYLKFNEKSLPNKKEFYGNLNMEDMTYVDYKHILANNSVFGKTMENVIKHRDL